MKKLYLFGTSILVLKKMNTFNFILTIEDLKKILDMEDVYIKYILWAKYSIS